MRTALILVVVSAALAASTAASGLGVAMCKGSQLVGSFAAVPGSAGAGSITYALRLRNSSKASCSVTGLPQGRLLGRRGGALPTHIRAAFPGALTAILVTLSPGRSARATARFSPDVPGIGEQTRGACEPTAYALRVTARGGGTTTVRVLPPTAVCEHGRLLFSAYRR
jgi:Protein of unknown function (DUF4232)